MFLKRSIGIALTFIILVILAFGQVGTTPPTFPRTNDKRSNKVELVDINSASREQLAALSGIGEEYANKVIAGRPYKSKKELKTRKILPQVNYKQIADKITAKQTTK